MSEPQFTKGPYRVINKIEDDEDRFHVVPSGSTHYIIATIGNCQPGDCVETELYTAHLFAAAPDLYEALQKLKDISEDCEPIVPWDPIWDEVKAALLRATGKGVEG